MFIIYTIKMLSCKKREKRGEKKRDISNLNVCADLIYTYISIYIYIRCLFCVICNCEILRFARDSSSSLNLLNLYIKK